ncbi:thiol reductant ABC exporter subunit CydC [Glutamicibacter arilaitensis]|uniref:thiol reductant ABC exporter subunit CydC n=1 Tax=Glutamicibacter arilaitensis TaxID=256701 RepID=UPI003FCF4E86
MPAPRFLPSELITSRQFIVLAAFSALKVVGLIMVAYALGLWIATMATAGENDRQLLGLAVIGAVLRALSAWGLNAGARRMGLGAKERLRLNLVRNQATQPTIAPAAKQQSIPVIATLASHGLEKLDDYFTKFIPALIGALAVPVLLGLYILQLDWISAVVLLLTIPLIPVFMALIGMHTQDTLNESQATLDQLAHQLYELAQGLPALLGLGRARAHGNAIAAVSNRYRQATMANLKTVFMSSFWLELIATLAVAVLAVMIGVRLVGGNMDLAAGLTILILAPELFSALREVGSAYHAADDGLAAYQKYTAITTGKPGRQLRSTTATNPQNILEISDLQFSYDGLNPIHQTVNLTLAAGEHRVLSTPSGTGKSTLLTLIAEAHSSDNSFNPELASGRIFVANQLATISQHPQFNAATGWLQLDQDAPAAPAELRQQLSARLGMEPMLNRPIGEYSPGELRRLEVMRALLRIHSDAGCTLLLADEPTAHLDERNAQQVRELLEELPSRCALLIASHDPAISQGHHTRTTPLEVNNGLSAPQAAGELQEPEAVAAGVKEPRSEKFNPLRELLVGYKASPKALLWGSTSVLCAVALAALSGWLIVESSYQPAILHLTVAFVMVRTLGIGRAVFRYLEQLAIHDAVLAYATDLREKMWNAMVSNPARWGLLSRSSVILRYLLAEVDELRDLLARVLFPPLQGIVVWVAAAMTLYFIQPEFGYLAMAAALVLAFPVRWLVQRIEGEHLVHQLRHRMQMNQSALGILRHKLALRSNQRLENVIGQFHEAETLNTQRARRHALGQGSATALATLISVLLAIAITALSHSSASFTALAVLLSLALGESAGNALLALQQGRALKELSAKLAERGMQSQDLPATREHPLDQGSKIVGFELDSLSLGYEQGTTVVAELSAHIPASQWTAITGPSGSGKSTLLTALLGALPAQGGALRGIDADGNLVEMEQADLSSVAWCPQEAHLFDSTIRRNLMLAVAQEQNCTDAELHRVLEQVGLAKWFAQQPAGLESRIGSGGHQLSGGQRCKLAVARAILGGHQIILLDEPTAHLGEDEAGELISTLHQALADRTVVLITHDQNLAGQCAYRIDLGARKLKANA